MQEIKAVERVAKRQNAVVSVHIKINTGMNRQGVDGLNDLEEILQFIKRSKNLVLGGAYSHFAEPENKNSLITAQNAFLLANNLVKRYNNKAVCHISASGGLLQGVYFDMVRIGILLYGYKPFESDRISVSPIMKVYSPVIKKRTLNSGATALYGNCITQTEKEISLVRYGYADGLPRQSVLGQFNNRCMDLTALDCPKIINNNAVIMDDADTIAKQYGTISYEVLTKVAIRAEKIYLR